jgi:O-acetyl-ADP-ribose deacetylase (regulator of RNase III)
MPRLTHERPATSIERDLRRIYRLRGTLVPTSPEEVAAAEKRFASELLELPDALNVAPVLAPERARPFPLIGPKRYWTNPSVLALQADDPVEAITQRARQVVLSAMEEGWTGPPYDPSQLAELLGIALLPTEAVIDARTKSKGNKFRIEFNPVRPSARLRFSLAHEIGHTLFPDCALSIRNRATHEDMQGDEWQLEMLCNVAAAEILMPIGSLPNFDEFVPTVDSVLQFRRRFQVSCEAVLMRLLRLTSFNCFAFAAHRDPTLDRYKVDYVVSSRGFRESVPLTPGFTLPKNARALECTAIGYTAKGRETWAMRTGEWETEYLGVAPYPGQTFPRVLAIIRSPDLKRRASKVRFLKGDASQPRGSGTKLLLQIVNDKALTWGSGFARALRNRWPSAQRQFTDWAGSSRREFRLGAVQMSRVQDDLLLASLVAQHGYGPSDKPRLRYAALEQCLLKVAELARQHSATIHLPRIGTGQAGGAWAIVEEIIEQTLGKQELDVTVYDLPNQRWAAKKQPSLFDVPAEVDQFI